MKCWQALGQGLVTPILPDPSALWPGHSFVFSGWTLGPSLGPASRHSSPYPLAVGYQSQCTPTDPSSPPYPSLGPLWVLHSLRKSLTRASAAAYKEKGLQSCLGLQRELSPIALGPPGAQGPCQSHVCVLSPSTRLPGKQLGQG